MSPVLTVAISILYRDLCKYQVLQHLLCISDSDHQQELMKIPKSQVDHM